MGTRVYLVRHSETVLTTEERFAGSTDVELSDAGRAQARRLSERLKGETFAAVYASPLSRAKETAAIVAAPHRMEPQLVPDLREIGHGRWEGLTRAEVEARFGDEFSRWEEDPFGFAPVGGETGASVLARALPALREIVDLHGRKGKKILVVSHKATIRLLACGLIGIDPRGYRDKLELLPASLSIVEFKSTPPRARLARWNDVTHLEGAAGAP